MQIQMRCMKLNGEGREHSWPKHGWLRFNGKQLMPLTQPPENTSARKRKDEPFNVTTLCTAGRNSVEIIQYNDDDVYVGFVLLVNKKSSQKYCEEIKKNNISTVDECVRRIGKLLDDKHDEITLVDKNRKCSLKCPMTMIPISTPARGIWCEHIDCFNLET